MHEQLRSGGSRSYFVFLNLNNMKVKEVPQQGPSDRELKGAKSVMFPEGVVCVERMIFRGKDLGIRIYVRPANAAKLLPMQVDLTKDEKTVLSYTTKLKASYGGIKNYRFVEANRDKGITLPEWEKAKADLIQRKLLNRAGAITNKGRNALSQAAKNESLDESLEEVPFSPLSFASAFAHSMGYDQRAIKANDAKDGIYVEMDKLDKSGFSKLRRFSFHQPKWGSGVSVTMLDVNNGHLEPIGNFKSPDVSALVTMLGESMKSVELPCMLVGCPSFKAQKAGSTI